MAEHLGSAQYDSSYRATLALAEKVPADLRTIPGVCGVWSLKDLLGHLAFWDGDLALELEAKLAGQRLPTSSERDWQTINADQTRKRESWDWDSIMIEVRTNHQRLMPLLIDPGENLEDDPIHDHWDEHRAQIEAWLATRGDPDSQETVEAIRDRYLTLQQSAMDVATSLPESMRNESGVCGDWTLTELLAHLAFWDGVVADKLSAQKSGREWHADSRGYDLINADAVAARAGCSWNEILTELTTNRDRLNALLADPGEGDGFKIYMHWQAHGAQIEAWAAEHSHV